MIHCHTYRPTTNVAAARKTNTLYSAKGRGKSGGFRRERKFISLTIHKPPAPQQVSSDLHQLFSWCKSKQRKGTIGSKNRSQDSVHTIAAGPTHSCSPPTPASVTAVPALAGPRRSTNKWGAMPINSLSMTVELQIGQECSHCNEQMLPISF